MISKDIYRTIVTELADDLKRQGLIRVKAAFPAWTKAVDGKYATIWCQAARQGGQFTIEFHYSIKPKPGTAKWNERYRLYDLLENTERHDLERFSHGDLSTSKDFWFLASSPHMVSEIARWLKPKIEALLTRITEKVSNQAL